MILQENWLIKMRERERERELGHLEEKLAIPSKWKNKNISTCFTSLGRLSARVLITDQSVVDFSGNHQLGY
jgi:hypothetical protein